MARGVNKVILVGNLGNDPETRYLPDGNAVTNITVATSENWTDKQGQRQERTEWHRVVFFRRLAEIAGEYLKKGSKVYIEGKLQTRQWEKEGQKHYSTEILADQMQMLDSRSDSQGGGGYSGGNSGGNSGGGGGGRSQSNAPASNNSEPEFNSPPPEDFDDDIPF